ncbi:GDSL esterase/lipase At1g09390 [Nymphaea colorata]|nr:GDSL esterase/lipase At1g09390 [Nymphaea colorata]
MALLERVSHLFLSILLLFSCGVALGAVSCRRNPIIFNFGDSNSDTGGLLAGLGLAVGPPNGRVFFRRSTGRFCDGRLAIDFLCEHLNAAYLSPYLDALVPNFFSGANFAIAGSGTLPPFVAFSLNIQVLQFLRFKSRILEIKKEHGEHPKFPFSEDEFQHALYMLDIGQNDLSHAFSANLTYSQVIEKIPTILEQIKSAVESLYANGARNFQLHNTGPLGCLPQKVSMFGEYYTAHDENGCLNVFNDAAKVYNTGLKKLCAELRTNLKNSTIVHVDIYSIKYDLIANHAKYGFQDPLMACCGYGGPPYNFNDKVRCGQTGIINGSVVRGEACKEALSYVSWDGIHYTEASNAIIASKILSTNYSEPQTSFDFFCQI